MVEIIDKIGFNPIRIILLSLDQFGAYKFQIMQLKKTKCKRFNNFFHQNTSPNINSVCTICLL